MPVVDIQGVGRVQFPDDMTPDQITHAIETDILKQPAEPSTSENVARQTALTGRAVGEGVVGATLGTAEQFGKAMTGGDVVDRALVQYTGKNRMQHDIASFNKMFGTSIPEAGSVPELLSALLTKAGAPTPETAGEQMASAVTRGVSGALAMPLNGASPVMAAISGGSGSAASEYVRQKGGGRGAQLAAGVAAGLAPGLIKAGAAEGTKRLLRGGASAEDVQRNIDDFKSVGMQPSAGQATQNRALQATESTLSRTPGAAGVMAKAGSQQADDMGAQIERTAESLAPKATAEQAGRAIQRGISGEGGFTEKFKAQQGQLYDKLDQFIAPSAEVDMTRTMNALKKLNADIPEASELSKWFKNSRIQGIEGALKKDTSIPAVPDMEVVDFNPMGSVTGQPTYQTRVIPGAPATQRDWMPYEAVKKLRTLVGNELADSGLMSDVPRSKWKALYSALSEDLGQAAAKDPNAKAAWTRANNYTRAGIRRLETLDSVIDKSGGPEAVFRAATSGTKEGATTLRAVMQSLPQDGQKTVAATVLRRMGRAKAGVQNDLGEAFSTETFLTNWNSLAPEAKVVLFNRFGPDFRKNMDTVARVASNLRTGSNVFRNPSGTAGAAATYTTAGAAAMAVLTGHPGTAAAIGVGVAGANLTARLMTHPPFVAWLAKATRAPMEAYPALVTQLSRSGDPLMQEAGAALQQAPKEGQDSADQ